MLNDRRSIYPGRSPPRLLPMDRSLDTTGLTGLELEVGDHHLPFLTVRGGLLDQQLDFHVRSA